MDSERTIAKHSFKEASKESRKLAEMRWWFWWESFPFWGIQSSPGAILVISEAATATHHAVPAHLTLTLCYTVVLTVAPVVRHINEGAGTGPGHISAPLCVHKGHEAQVQSHPPLPDNTNFLCCDCGTAYGQAQPAWWGFQDLLYPGQRAPETAVSTAGSTQDEPVILSCVLSSTDSRLG